MPENDPPPPHNLEQIIWFTSLLCRSKMDMGTKLFRKLFVQIRSNPMVNMVKCVINLMAENEI